MKKEINILNYFNMRALFMGIGISKILITCKEYIGISCLIGTIIGILLLYTIKIEVKNNLLSILINSTLIIIALIIIINMISTMYLTEMPKFLIGLPIIILLMYIMTKREITIFRISNILLILNLILYSIALLSLLKYFNISNFSYSNTPLKNVLTASFEFALFSTVPTLITKDKDYHNISIIKTYIISSITMSIIFLLTYGILGKDLIEVIRYPEYFILKKVQINGTLENIENLISFMWIFDIFMLLTSCTNCIRKNSNSKYTIYILLPLLLLITSTINKYYSLIISTYNYTPIILFMILMILITFSHKKKVNNHFSIKELN